MYPSLSLYVAMSMSPWPPVDAAPSELVICQSSYSATGDSLGWLLYPASATRLLFIPVKLTSPTSFIFFLLLLLDQDVGNPC